MSDEAEQADQPVTVKVSGDFSFPLNAAFQAVLQRYPKGERTFVVDLEGVDELDSSALGMLLQLREHSRDGQALAIRNPSPAVRAVLAESAAQKLLRFSDA
jgi:anti-anti-sigma factor